MPRPVAPHRPPGRCSPPVTPRRPQADDDEEGGELSEEVEQGPDGDEDKGSGPSSSQEGPSSGPESPSVPKPITRVLTKTPPTKPPLAATPKKLEKRTTDALDNPPGEAIYTSKSSIVFVQGNGSRPACAGHAKIHPVLVVRLLS